MKLSGLKKEWLQVLILAVPFCVIVLLWHKLPGWVPIHWNARGEVDGIARKAFGTLLLPTINVAAALLLGLLPRIDPRLARHDEEMRASLWRTLKIFRLGITGFLSLTSLAMLAAALGLFKNGASFSHLIYAGIAVLFMLMGNSMAKLRPNYLLGIRTPWTLESKEVWAKTHRVGGRVMVTVGLLMLALCFLVPIEQYVYWVILPGSIGFSIFAVAYSYVLYRKEQSTQVPH